METLCLFVEVPVCAFRPHWSREYQDTYPFPPPSTVYGMLLSLAGVDWQQKGKYAGVHMALALEGEPKQSRVLRKFRRFSASKVVDPFTFRRPDYQDLLLWLKLWVWIHDGEAQASLVEKVRISLTPAHRGEIQRYGGLSLGESSHLINDVSLREPDCEGRFLCR
ncbi:MAG: type I-MYXAN CRISPR-associated protein Cas5/Cmx5/DevS, partial [Deltaproteobacteria bacterium]|nr:type I-MYXAN CRISPR-associated protein Cas5/Cmx5/DevS [Deltaproteobacteria bacterium]